MSPRDTKIWELASAAVGHMITCELNNSNGHEEASLKYSRLSQEKLEELRAFLETPSNLERVWEALSPDRREKIRTRAYELIAEPEKKLSKAKQPNPAHTESYEPFLIDMDTWDDAFKKLSSKLREKLTKTLFKEMEYHPSLGVGFHESVGWFILAQGYSRPVLVWTERSPYCRWRKKASEYNAVFCGLLNGHAGPHEYTRHVQGVKDPNES